MSNRDLWARDLYDELGVSPAATAGEIRRAWRHLALRYHPDLNHGRRAACEELLKKINGAATLLLDDAARADYDRQRLRSWPPAAAPVPGRPAASPTASPAPSPAPAARGPNPEAAAPPWTPPYYWSYTPPRRAFTVLRAVLWLLPIALPLVASLASHHHRAPTSTPYTYAPSRYEQPWRELDPAPSLYTPEPEAIRWPEPEAAPEPKRRAQAKRSEATTWPEYDAGRELRKLLEESGYSGTWGSRESWEPSEHPWRVVPPSFSFEELVAPRPSQVASEPSPNRTAPPADECGLGRMPGPCP